MIGTSIAISMRRNSAIARAEIEARVDAMEREHAALMARYKAWRDEL